MNKLTNYNTKDLYNFYAYVTTQKEFNLYNYDYDDHNLYNVIVLNEINNKINNYIDNIYIYTPIIFTSVFVFGLNNLFKILNKFNI